MHGKSDFHFFVLSVCGEIIVEIAKNWIHLMSSKKETVKKIVNTRSRSRLRFVSCNEDRSNSRGINEVQQEHFNNSTQIYDQSVRAPDPQDQSNVNEAPNIVNTQSGIRHHFLSLDQNPHASIPEIHLSANETRDNLGQIVRVNAQSANSSNTCQTLVRFGPTNPFVPNFDRTPQSNSVIQHISVPDQIFRNLNFSSIQTLVITIRPNFSFNQFIIRQAGQEYIFTNIPFVKTPSDSDFAFVNRDIRAIENRPNQNRNFERPTMGIFSVKDLVSAIPTYNGDERQLETFINICSKYYSLIEVDQKPQFVTIVQTKITGEALADLQPIDDLKNWPDIKAKLEEKVRTPDTYEFAQEELSTIRQKKGESMEEYGKRIRKGLEKLNLATKSLTQEEAAMIPLRKANEIHAIRKFEQNMFDEKIKLMIGAANFNSLRDAIKFSMNKELFHKTTSVKTCSFCKNIGHIEEECRKKSLQSNAKKEQKHGSDFPQNNNPNNLRRNNTNYFNSPRPNNDRNGQRFYYGYRNYNSNGANFWRNPNYSNQPSNYPRANSNEPNSSNSRPISSESNTQETCRNQNNGGNNNNGQSRNYGSSNPSNSRFDRNAPKNMRTIHEINSQLEAMAITEERNQSQNSANTPKN